MPIARSAPQGVSTSTAQAALSGARAHITSAVQSYASRGVAPFLGSIMAQLGRALSESGPAIWPRVVIETALALGGSTNAAAIAAAAVELSVAAIDVADELMDNDWRGDAADRARAQNAAVALSFLATSCVADLAIELGPERACLMRRILNEGSFACCDGQDLDVVLERTSDVTEDTAFAMTQRKSGSLIAMACRVGAAVANLRPADHRRRRPVRSARRRGRPAAEPPGRRRRRSRPTQGRPAAA